MSKLESQKGGSGEGSWEAFWGRKTVPKGVFEGCMMVLEKDANFDAKMEGPGFINRARDDSRRLGPPEIGGWVAPSEIQDSRYQRPEIRGQEMADIRTLSSSS